MSGHHHLPVLTADDLKAEAPRPTAGGVLFSLSAFAAYGGNLVALVGANGAGKSTLLRTWAGEPGWPVQGKWSFHWDGLARNLPADLGSKPLVAWLPQQLQVPFHLTAGQVALAGRYRHKAFWQPYDEADMAMMRAAFAALDISQLENEPMASLSGGEQQLVWLAQVQLQEAQVVLLDEPMQHLDLYHKYQVLRWMQSQTQAGKLVLFSTHDVAMLHGSGARLLYIGPECQQLDDSVASINTVTEWLLRPSRSN